MAAKAGRNESNDSLNQSQHELNLKPPAKEQEQKNKGIAKSS